jgi:hypothetical protein
MFSAGLTLSLAGNAFAQEIPTYAQPGPGQQQQQPQYPQQPPPQQQQPNDQEPQENLPMDDGPPQQSDAANGPAVARLSFLRGDVTVERGDDTEPLAGAVNAPVLAGDYLATGQNAYGEVQFDALSMVRLDENTQVRIARLDTAHEVELAQGTVELATLEGADGRPEVDTPSISVQADSNALVRVTVTPDGQTTVTVRRGTATVEAPSGEQQLTRGQSLAASGSAADATTQPIETIAGDSFDRFNAQRNSEQLAALQQPATQDVAPVDGVADLNAYGQWTDDAQYGEVWQPTAVAADWAPYRDGRWVWEDGWGYTWVAAEPWGWAPYHYGSWFYRENAGWAWVPPHRASYGVAYVQPVWRPAMVGFLTFGVGDVSIGVGFGNVGWVPLAPGEPWHSWYGGYGGRNVVVNNYYISNTTVHYRNILVARGGVTSVRATDFQAGRFGHPVAVAPEELRTARIGFVRGALPIVPTSASLRFSERPVTTTFVRSAVFARPAFTARIPTAVQNRQAFSVQREHVDTTVRAYGTRTGAPVLASPVRPAGGNYDNRPTGVTNGNAPARTNTGGYTGDRPATPTTTNGDRETAPTNGSGYTRPAAPTTTDTSGLGRLGGATSRPQTTDGAAGNGYSRPQNTAAPTYARPQTNGTTSNGNANGYGRLQTSSPTYARPQTNGTSSSGYYNGTNRPQSYGSPRPQAGSNSGYTRVQSNGANGGYVRPTARPANGGYSRPAPQRPQSSPHASSAPAAQHDDHGGDHSH